MVKVRIFLSCSYFVGAFHSAELGDGCLASADSRTILYYIVDCCLDDGAVLLWRLFRACTIVTIAYC